MPSSELLSRYAEVAVRVGVGLETGQRLLISSSVEVVELTRHLVEAAYRAGASNVDVMWGDDRISRARFEHGPTEAAEVVTTGTRAAMAAFEAGDQFLYVAANDPNALAGIDPARIAGFQRINQTVLEPLNRARGSLQRQWSVVGAPNPAWATSVFPDVAEAEAIELLWSAIFRACRIDQDDPVSAWHGHVADLNARSRHLTSRSYTSLRYRGPGTDLTLGLPDEPIWIGGSAGGSFVPNIPTEEVFCGPHRLKGDGVVTATKPLSLFGNLVEGFSFRIADGRIVEAKAAKGQAVLDQLLATDEGSIRFGECAMVPMSSAVAVERLIWNNTLFDENDGCHIAVGRAYPINIEGGPAMTADELTEAGLNLSTTHVDFVVGSADLDVFGVTAGGAEEPIISSGEWGFTP
jgi:aminopeptidase